MLLFFLISFGIFGLLFYIGSDKAKENGHDWLIVPVIVLFFLIMTFLSIKSCFNSCTSKYPSTDYYDSPRK